MNTITLKGFLRNIQYSHTINGVEYNKAELIVPNDTSEDDILSIRFKKFSKTYSKRVAYIRCRNGIVCNFLYSIII